MPFVRLETSLDLPAVHRQHLMRALIACTAEQLSVPAEACRAAYALVDPADCLIGNGTNEPWAIAYVHLKAGRTAAVKGAFTAALFDLLASELHIERSAVRILIAGYAPDDWNNGGDAAVTPR